MGEKLPALTRTKTGAWQARKALPFDIRDRYAELYGARYEAKFAAARDVTPAMAKARYGVWLAEVENRVAALRSNKETRLDLSAREARALAGDWYLDFVATHENQSRRDWHAELNAFLAELKRLDDRLAGDLWQQTEAVDLDAYLPQHKRLRAALRPIVSDLGQAPQFLANRGLALSNETEALFLDFVTLDLIDAFTVLDRQSQGDYSPDPRPATFGKFANPKTAPSPSNLSTWELWEAWVKAVQPAASTAKRWGRILRKLDTKHPNAATITPDLAQDFIRDLAANGSAFSVRTNYLAAYKTVFTWAVETRRLPVNPFKEIKVRVPKRVTLREKEFTTDEWRTILTAANAATDPVLRWLPWLCAYSGARAGEISQLRAEDVVQVNGLWCMKLTPAAGTIKTRTARPVPLHQALIEQGFLTFVNGKRGRLFAPEKPVDVIVDEVGRWVRKDLKITDRGLSPNHSWRHTFKAIGFRVGISERLLDAICGHKPVNVGRGYGAPTVSDMAKALEQFPRYQI